jgi:hypothetical protein
VPASVVKALSNAVEAIDAVVPVAGPTARASVLPGGLLAVVALFMTLQNRFDRHDPKLASAPVNNPDNEFVEREQWP